MPFLRFVPKPSIRAGLVALFACCAALAAPGGVDWSAYTASFRIAFTGYDGTETLTDFPVLVKLSEASSAGFRYADCQVANGGDLRFADADGNLLSSEVDTWDENGTSFVWVKVPALNAATVITAHYGCRAPDAVTAADVWSNGYVGVWHLGETDAAEAGDGTFAVAMVDSSGVAGAFTAAAGGTALGANGAVGKGVDFAIEQTAGLRHPGSSALGGMAACTVEAWAYQTERRADGFRHLLTQDGVRKFYDGEGECYQMVTVASDKTIYSITASAPVGRWNHFAHVYDADNKVEGRNAFLYLNGAFRHWADASGRVSSAEDVPLYLGNRNFDWYNDQFMGGMDEVRISNVARSADWIKASHDTVASDTFAVYAAGVADDWSGYAARFTVTFAGYAGAETLTDFPVLVRLSEVSVPGFTYADCRVANGGDLRFADADGNLLASEVDTWDEAGESCVWVKVPSLSAGTVVTAYYGNRTPHAVDPRDVWSNGYAAVWHLGAVSLPLKDSTGRYAGFTAERADTSAVEYAVAGAAGGAVDFNGGGGNASGIRTDAASGLAALDAFTFECWVSQSAASSKDRYLCNFNGENGPFVFWENGGYVRAKAFIAEGRTLWANEATIAPVACSDGDGDAWNHIAFRQDLSADSANGNHPFWAMVNGGEPRSVDYWDGGSVFKSASVALWLGGHDEWWSGNCYAGKMDEVRISRVARSDDWLKATCDTVAADGFAVYSSAVKRAGLSILIK